jgi:hypothetical protein
MLEAGCVAGYGACAVLRIKKPGKPGNKRTIVVSPAFQRVETGSPPFVVENKSAGK